MLALVSGEASDVISKVNVSRGSETGILWSG